VALIFRPLDTDEERLPPLHHGGETSPSMYFLSTQRSNYKMKHDLEVEVEDENVYNYVEYKIIIRNARKIWIRLFLTNLLLKWAKKVFPGTMTIEENTDFVN
jgi:hypothetical protein